MRRFVSDSESFLDNYHELLGILEQVKKSNLGVVNKTLNNLRAKTKEFLKNYDENENGMIDVTELVAKWQLLAKDLSKQNEEKSQLKEIVSVLKEIEKAVSAYWQGTIEENISQEANDENEFYQEIQVRIE